MATGTTRPFEGLLVIDFGVGGVGVEVGRLFAEYGAEVIKIETHAKLDFMRSITPNRINPSFASSSRSKKGLGVNLRDKRGLELVEELVRRADVVVDNNATGVMERLGFSAARLRELNPTLIVFTSQSVGSEGPWSNWTGYGPSTHPVSGMQWLWNFPEDVEQPAGSVCIFPDHLVGRLGAIASIAGLIQRETTGQGFESNFAQFETPMQLLGDLYARESLEPGSVRPAGNRSSEGAPFGAYPCAGDDEWVAICVRSDDEWRRLVAAIGSPDWAAAPELADEAGRRRAHDSIDAALAEWTCERTPQEARDVLQAAGVAAGDVQHALALLGDPHLAAREFLQPVEQTGLTTLLFEGPFFHASDLPPPDVRPAPLLGEHTKQICRENLGLADSEIEQLVRDGVLELVREPEAD